MRINALFFLLLVVLFTVSCNDFETIYVSAEGNDRNDGSINSPYLTASKALAEVRVMKIDAPNKDVVISFREGTYRIDDSLALDSLMSGVSIKAYKDEKVVFSGGVPISNEFIKQSINHHAIDTPKGTVWKVNLKEAAITDFGQIRNVGFSRPYGPSWGEIFVNGKPMHLAQWPNNLVIPMGQVLYTGSIPRNDDFANKGGVIQYDSLRVDRWVEEKNPWMAGYFHAGSDNIYTNNIFLNGKQGIRIGNRLETWAKSLLDEDGLFQTRLEEVNYQQPPYSIEYPSMVNYFDKEHQPTGNSVSGNLFVNMDEELHGKEEWAGWDSSNVVSDKSIEVEYTENGDVMFSDKELIYQLIPELKSIPLDRIGLYGGKKK